MTCHLKSFFKAVYGVYNLHFTSARISLIYLYNERKKNQTSIYDLKTGIFQAFIVFIELKLSNIQLHRTIGVPV